MKRAADDGIPAFLKIPQAKRNAAWANCPPAPVVKPAEIPAPSLAPPMEFVERKKNKTSNRIARLKQNHAASTIPEEFRRWDPRRGTFVDERVDFDKRLKAAAVRLGVTLENAEMSKIAIVPYLTHQVLPATRGKSSVKADAPEWEVKAAVLKAALRAGKKIHRVEVVSPEGVVIATWTLDSENKTLHNSAGETVPLVVEEPSSASPSGVQEETQVSKKASTRKAKSNGNGAAAPRGPGVISTIVEAMGRKSGVTVEEVVAILAKKFPDRKQKSMTSTAKIQLAKNAKTKEKTEGRGLIYYGG